MMNNFWQSIDKPIFALAPMEDVSDTVFREIILSISDPDILQIVFTEFTSTDGLCDSRGKIKVIERLKVNESEQELLKLHNTKLIAQIWGSEPNKFYQSAQLINSLGLFDGIDINMGCPVKKVVKNKSCSALINYPNLAKEIIQATQNGSNLPVSVKTRIGFNTINTEEWMGHLLETDLSALTVHGRTQKMQSEGLAMWDEIAKTVDLRNKLNKPTIILGNGDVCSYTDAILKTQQFGVDGVMVGTGIFKNLWLFNQGEKNISLDEKLDLLVNHIQLFDKTWQNHEKNYNVLKRFYKIYINGFNGASDWREMLMNTNHCQDALTILSKLKSKIPNEAYI